MEELNAWVERDGAISARRHPELRHRIRHAIDRGELVPVLPGATCVAAGHENDWRALAAAARQHDPTNVLIGGTAAAVTYWKERPVNRIEVASRTRLTRPGRFVFQRCWVDPAYVVRQVATDVWAAVDLLETDGPVAVDRLRERRIVHRPELEAALESMRSRPGNRIRSAIIRADAWSEAERIAQALLTAAGIRGWRANAPIVLPGGEIIADLLFSLARLIVEVDGWEVHGTRKAFEADRRRDAALVRAGFRVIRVTWKQLHEPGYFLDLVLDLLGPNVVLARDLRA